MAYICPVCAYSDLPEPPQNFSICPCCGTEFGYDDAKTPHAALRKRWIGEGAQWVSRARAHSPEWNPWLQLIEAGFRYDVPFYVVVRQQQSWNERELTLSRVEGPFVYST